MSRTTRLNTYVASVVAIAMIVAALSALLPFRAVEWTWWGAIVLLVAVQMAEAGIVEITRESDEAGYGISVATVPQLACVLLLPPPVACLLAGASMLLDEFKSRSPLPKLAFNVATTVASVGLAAIAAGALGIQGAGLGEAGWSSVAALTLVAACYYLANTVPVAAVGAIAGDRPILPAIVQNARATAAAEYAFALMGGLAAFVWVMNPFWLIVGIAPAAISQLALRYVAERNRRAAQLSALDRLGQQLSRTASVDEVFDAANSHLHAVPSAAACFLVLGDGRSYFSDGFGNDEADNARALRLTSEVQATGETRWVPDAHSEEDGGSSSHTRSWLVLPLAAREGPRGALGVLARDAHAFTAKDREFLGLVAERVGLAVEVARRAAQLERMAFHDTLTGLPNRELLGKRLTDAVRVSATTASSTALLFLDLDHFKEINDTFGHRHGDLVLCEIARRLASELPGTATLARLAGDEFAVLLPGADAVEASRVAEALLRCLAQTVRVHEMTFDVGASIGIAAAPEHATQPDDLLRQADVAMYVAKQRRGDFAIYSPDHDVDSRDRLELAADLRGAIDRGELRLQYQPIVSLQTGRLEEVEALVRWDHPQRGLVSPGVFVPIAEETGMIAPLGRWVLEEACRQATSWRQRYASARSLIMSVNLSGRQFQHTHVPNEIGEILRKTGMDARSLKLEITESVAMGDTEVNIAALWLLKGMGIRLAIDDFGTGYSSLGYLKRFPVDTLKIDKCFVDGLGMNPEDSAIIGAIVAFAGAVGLSTTAEGVEDAEQVAHLHRLGADRVQGYYCSRPLSAEQFEALLATPRNFLGDQRGGTPVLAA